MGTIVPTALIMVILLAGTAFSKTDPFLVTPCVGVGNFTLGMTEEALLRVAEKGSLKDVVKENQKNWREIKKRSSRMRDEVRKEIEEIEDTPVLERYKEYTYTYPGTKITLDLFFFDFLLESIHFYSPKFRTQEAITLENFLYKENTRYVVELNTMSDGSLYARYFLRGLSFYTNGRLSGLVSISPFCTKK